MSFLKYKSDLSDTKLRKAISVLLRNKQMINEKVKDQIIEDLIVAASQDNLEYKDMNNIISKWNDKVK
jgi:hypothetical protein